MLMNIVQKRIQQGYCGAWFNGITRTKVDAVDWKA